MSPISLRTSLSLTAFRERLEQLRPRDRLTDPLARGQTVIGSGGQTLDDLPALRNTSRTSSTGVAGIRDSAARVSRAEEALSEIEDLVQARQDIVELAGADLIGKEQLAALNQEFQSLGQEIYRIEQSTEYRGEKVFASEKSTAPRTQLTPFAVKDSFSLSADGSVGAYVRDGNNTTYVYDFTYGELTTIAAGGSSGKVSLSADGNTLAFVSNLDLTGDNSSNRNQIFVQDLTTGSVSQVTDAQGVEDYTGLTISGDGSAVAAVSLTAYNTDGSQAGYEGSSYVYVFDLETGQAHTSGTHSGGGDLGTVASLSLSNDGRYLSFTADGDPEGTNGNGNSEVFLLDTEDTTSFTQVTATAGSTSFSSQVSADGEVYFVSNKSFGGLNDSGDYVVYRYSDPSSSYSVVNTTGGSSAQDTAAIELSGDGSQLYALSQVDYTGENGDGLYQVYAFDLTSGDVTQRTENTTAYGGLGISNFLFSDDGYTLLATNGSNELYAIDATPGTASFEISTGSGETSDLRYSFDLPTSRVRAIASYSLTSSDSISTAESATDQEEVQISGLREEYAQSASGLQSTSTRVEQAVASQESLTRDTIRNLSDAEELGGVLQNAILTESGVALFAQANQNPDTVLELLAPSKSQGETKGVANREEDQE